MTTEAQQLMDLAAAGKLDLNAEHPVLTAGEGTTTPPGAKADDDTTTADPKAGDAPDDSDEPPGAPIASKSGTYTIPHDKLVKAREDAKTYKAEKDALAQENAALAAQLAELTAAQQQNLAIAQQAAAARSESGAPATEADRYLEAATAAAGLGVDLAIFGDFSEEGIAKGIATLNAQAEARVMSKLDERVAEKVAAALKPHNEKAAQSDADAHYSAIYAKHADADEIVQSAEFAKWLEGQSGFVRAGISHAMAKGATADVIEVFDNFKAAFAKGGGAASDAVTKALANATAKPLQSLSDLPGAAGMSDTETVMALANDPQKLMDFMNSLPEEKRVRLMSRVV